MKSSKIYKIAREYLGLSKEDVCSILGWEMEELEAIESGAQPSLDAEGQLYKLYRLGDRDIINVNDYPISGDLNERDKREVAKMFLFADEMKEVDKD